MSERSKDQSIIAASIMVWAVIIAVMSAMERVLW